MDASKESHSKIAQDIQGKNLDAKLDKNVDPSRAPIKPVDASQHSSKAEAVEKCGHLCKGGLSVYSVLPHSHSEQLQYSILLTTLSIFIIQKMDAIKAGVEKVKESVQGKRADDQAQKANDPTVKPSERVDAAFESGKATMKAQEHACKAECHKDRHVCN